MTAKAEQEITVGSIVRFWLPLAATWLMMSVEGPYIAAIVARMPDTAYNLAAYGVAFAFAWLAESPIMMLLTATNRLVHDRQSFLAMRRFAYALNVLVTALMVVAVTPPVFRFVAANVIGLPPEIASLLHPAVVILIPWPSAIGYRRFYQGLLVRRRMTRRVAYGTIIRLITMSATAASLALMSTLSGVVVGAFALVSGVLVEAIASRWMARHVVSSLLADHGAPSGPPLTQTAITRFYYPLAMTSMISMITGPMLTFFMGRGRSPIESLAVLPVVMNLVFMFRSGGVAYQDVGVALSGHQHEHEREVGRTAAILAAVSTSALALILFTPLVHVWFLDVAGLSPELAAFAILPAQLIVILPALEYSLSFHRSRFILNSQTRVITLATIIEVVGIGVALFVCVGPLQLVGVVAGSTALLIGRTIANAFLFGLHRASVRRDATA